MPKGKRSFVAKGRFKTVKKPFSVNIRWGSDPDQDVVSHYSFKTAAELSSFLDGVEESSGWMDYDIVEDD